MCRYSVIVPVYKVEKMLPRCIESILAQTVTDFELILIDDGSPDRSGEICDEFAAKDSRVRVIHQENGGVSKARNAGLDIAQGEYIVFVDSDDWVEKTYLEEFDSDDSDLVVSCVRVHLPDGSLKETTSLNDETIIISSDDNLVEALKAWYSITCYAKRFKRSVLEKMALRFDTSFQYGEDTIFVAEYLLGTHTIRSCGRQTYVYCREKSDSLTELAGETWVDSNLALQERLYNVYQDHAVAQMFLAKKYIWIVEKAISEICNSNKQGRNRRLKSILRTPHLSTCLKCCRTEVSFITKVVFLLNIPFVTIIRYKRK